MKLKGLLLSSATGLVSLFACAGVTLAEPLEAGVSTTSPMQNPSIRFIEAREMEFAEVKDRNHEPVAAIFNDSGTTTSNARSFSDRLQGIGVGANSQVAQTLCAIQAAEVPTRQHNLDSVYYHLDKVQGLLAEHGGRGPEVSSAIQATYAADPNAMYQGMHVSMETTRCVPESVNATIDEADQTRLAIVQTAR